LEQINNVIKSMDAPGAPLTQLQTRTYQLRNGQAVDLAARSLGEWRNPQQPAPIALPPAPILTSLRQERVTVNGKSQADVLLGAVGPERMAPDYTAAAIGNSILGQFGMMGRIGEAVREKAGLAYYAFSSLNAGVGPGPWQIAAGVAPGNVERAIELIRQEVRRFVESPVEEEELADVKANFIGSLPLSLESNGGVAGALVRLERYKLGLDYYQRYEDLVNAVTREDVLRAAQRYLHPERLGIAIAGP
jgi:zinc protease